MTTNFTKIWLLIISATISAGALYTLAQQQITIPTGPAKHDSTLTDLRLGGLNNEQIIKLGEQKELLIPGGLIVGDVTKNSVPGLKNSSVLGGGTDFGNKIIWTSENSIIGAGDENEISASNATIGAGTKNKISAEGSMIGGGYENEISSIFSTIGAGRRNKIAASHSIIPGGEQNIISANAEYSFAAGQMTNAEHPGSFLWSDYDNVRYEWAFLITTTGNTFLIRSLKGMSINTATAIDGVNVNIAGTAQIGKENKLSQDCVGIGAQFSGTYEQQDGCLYYCDGRHRQLLNTDTPGNAQRCGEQKPYSGNIAYTKCTLYGDIKKPYTMSFRAGESINAYSLPSDPNCASKKALITCQRNGKWSNENYKYLHCTKTN